MQSKECRLGGHILRRNCLLKHITEEKIGRGRRERRRKQLLEDFKETKGEWKLKYEALDQCFSTFVKPRPGKFYFYKTRTRSQQIYS